VGGSIISGGCRQLKKKMKAIAKTRKDDPGLEGPGLKAEGESRQATYEKRGGA